MVCARNRRAKSRRCQTLARKLKVEHRTLRWTGTQAENRHPGSGAQRALSLAGRCARARRGARNILTAHTLDDQAETVLFRLARGSGLTGLRGMARFASLPALTRHPCHRPAAISIPKSRLVATLRRAKISFADDPSNRDPRFTRPRLRALDAELSPPRASMPRALRLCARRMRGQTRQSNGRWTRPLRASRGTAKTDAVVLAAGYADLPAEVALRMLGRAVSRSATRGRSNSASSKPCMRR